MRYTKMALPLITKDEQIINEKARIKMLCRTEVKQLYLEIKENPALAKLFYTNLYNNINLLNELFYDLRDMKPRERENFIRIWPPVPIFLCNTGNKVSFLKVEERQFDIVYGLSDILNTDAANIARILFYISLPENLYSEFPYLTMHYKFIEDTINYYLEQIKSDKRLQLYDRIKILAP
jgi:hypothetical protein